MSKRILDAAVVTVLCLGLFAMSDIEETKKDAPDAVAYSLEQEKERELDAADVQEESVAVVAKNQRNLVTASFKMSHATEEPVGAEAMLLAEAEAAEKEAAYKAVEAKTVPTVMTAADSAESGETAETTAETAETTAETAETTAEPVLEEAAEESEEAVGSNRWGITLTESEIELLARIVWLEACGESEEGQKAVVEVIFNRIASDLFPNTLYEVLSQKNPVQFCSWKNRDSAQPTEKEYESIRQVLYGNTKILRDDTVYFSRKPLTANVDVRIGGHSFCY